MLFNSYSDDGKFTQVELNFLKNILWYISDHLKYTITIIGVIQLL